MPKQRLGKLKLNNPWPISRETLWRFNGRRQALYVRIHITPTIFLWVDNFPRSQDLQFRLTFKGRVQQADIFGSLIICNGPAGQVVLSGQDWARELIPVWLPIFRRGCWLSGLPIEATAHEKLEWMQGFHREEIEAWNLKF